MGVRTYRCEVPVTVVLSDGSRMDAMLGYPDATGDCVIVVDGEPVTLSDATVIIPPADHEGYIDSEGSGCESESMRDGIILIGLKVEVASP